MFSVQCSGPPGPLPVFRRRHQAAVPVRDRPMARIWFSMTSPRRPRLVLRPALRPWRPPVLLPVIPRQQQAAIPARDRPLDRLISRAGFRGPFPRRPRLVLRPVLRPWRPPGLLPVIPRKHQAAVPARDRPRDRPTARGCFRDPCPRLTAPTCSPSIAST